MSSGDKALDYLLASPTFNDNLLRITPKDAEEERVAKLFNFVQIGEEWWYNFDVDTPDMIFERVLDDFFGARGTIYNESKEKRYISVVLCDIGRVKTKDYKVLERLLPIVDKYDSYAVDALSFVGTYYVLNRVSIKKALDEKYHTYVDTLIYIADPNKIGESVDGMSDLETRACTAEMKFKKHPIEFHNFQVYFPDGTVDSGITYYGETPVRFRLMGRLGRGGFGVAYKVQAQIGKSLYHFALKLSAPHRKSRDYLERSFKLVKNVRKMREMPRPVATGRPVKLLPILQDYESETAQEREEPPVRRKGRRVGDLSNEIPKDYRTAIWRQRAVIRLINPGLDEDRFVGSPYMRCFTSLHIAPVMVNGVAGILMPLASGDLSKLLPLNHRQAVQVLKQISEQLKCISKEDESITYYDIKPENILYFCYGDVIEVTLGDIGTLSSRVHTYALIPNAHYGQMYVYLLCMLYGNLVTGKHPPLSADDGFYETEQKSRLLLFIRKVRSQVGLNKYVAILLYMAGLHNNHRRDAETLNPFAFYLDTFKITY
jgi:hypothetical protein